MSGGESAGESARKSAGESGKESAGKRVRAHSRAADSVHSGITLAYH